MSLMSTLIQSIPSIVEQEDEVGSIANAMGLYDKLYAPMEAWSEPEIAPTASHMWAACSNIVRCFSWEHRDMMRQYFSDLLIFKLMFVVGGGAFFNIYQATLDRIESRWTIASFSQFDAICTFGDIKVE